MKQKISKLVWLDLEMTGLDLDNDKIIEISVLVTTPDLEIIDKGYSEVIGISQKTVDKMSEYVRKMHTKNGLLDRCLNSKNTIEQAEKSVVGYLSKFVSPNEAPLCGNSISTDRAFLMKYMKKVDSFLHYRNIDVSTIKQLVNIYKPDSTYEKPDGDHRALDDVKASIHEMAYYKELLFDNN